LLHLQLELIARMGDRKVPRLASHACLDASMIEKLHELADDGRVSRVLVKRLAGREPGSCCTRFWADLAAPFPTDVSYMSIWSRLDGVVNPRACHDPDARLVEVRSSHCGMAWNRHVYRAVLEDLTAVVAREHSGERLAA
jgi:hypothetical protein